MFNLDKILKLKPRPKTMLERKDEFLEKFYRVGPDKPVSYLPVQTLQEIGAANINELRQEFESKGLAVRLLSDKESGVGSGALYVYDKNALGLLLEKNSGILERESWPTDPDTFIDHLVYTARDPDLYRVIEDAFGDTKSQKNNYGSINHNNKIISKLLIHK